MPLGFKLLCVVVCSVTWLEFATAEVEEFNDVRPVDSSVIADGSCGPEDGTTISTAREGVERDPCEGKSSSSPDLSLWRTEWMRGVLLHIKDSKCRTQLQETLRGLKSMELWAVQMMDSTGKIPSQLLSGNAHQFGDFDQCLGISHPASQLDSGHSTIQPQYCLALADVTAAANAPVGVKQLVHRVRGSDFIRSHRDQSSHFVPTYSTLKWGLCIPSSCTPTALTHAFNVYLNQTLPSYVTIQTSIEDRYCKKKQGTLPELLDDTAPSGRPLTTYLAMLLFAGLITISLLSTYLDQNCQDVPLNKMSKLEGLKVACSLKRGWQQFFDNKKEDIGCIHGLRTIASILLFIAHNTIPVASMPFLNRTAFTDITFTSFSSLFRSSIVYTNTFLFLSGVLSCYYLQSTSSILTRLGNRLIRMLPLLLLVIVFSGYILPYLGSGPLWAYIVESNANLCVESGWRNLLFVHNFYPFEKMCAPHTHHLALDMQLFVLTIPLVMGLKSRPVMTSVVMLLWNLGSAGLRYWTVLYHRISVIIYSGIGQQELYRAADLSYINPMHRASSYLCGMWLGFLLYKIKFHSVKLSKGALYAGWCATGLSLSYCLFSNYKAGEANYRYDVIQSANYAALEPMLTSLALSWIILVCSTGYGGSLNTFLSCRVMVLLSKMSFSIYLVQFCVFFYSLGTIRTSTTFTIWNLVAPQEFLVVILSSFVLTIAVDIPAQNLKSIIFR